MLKNEQERVYIFRRIISKDKNLDFLSELSDEKLLSILNSSILPNSISKNNLKYTLFSNYIMNNAETEKNVLKFSKIPAILSRVEKDIFKFGVFYGFDSYNASYQFSKFIKTSTDISVGKLEIRKKVSSKFFEDIFDFMYKIIYKGETNGQFPRF